MSKILMIAAMKYSKSEGISKKICMQASALSTRNDDCILLCLNDLGIQKIEYIDGKEVDSNTVQTYEKQNKILPEAGNIYDLLIVAEDTLSKDDFDMVYIRHMLPCVELVHLIKTIKRKSKIAYEIPTYPYYHEQLSISNNKLRTIVKLLLETIFWPIIYKNIHILCVVRCRSKSMHLKKMRDIFNGFSGKLCDYHSKDLNRLSMIGVGTIFPYHGYEKIIMDMKETNCLLKNGREIFFHIVGESAEITRLQLMVKKLKLENNVIFYGKQYGSDLEDIYEQANLGIGTLRLSLRNADIDTAIKNIEYLSYYLPVISSGKIFNMDYNSGLILQIPETERIDFNKIYDFVENFYVDSSKYNQIVSLLKQYTWPSIMNNIKQELIGKTENAVIQ